MGDLIRDSRFTYGRPRETEIDALLAVVSQALCIPPDRVRTIFARIGRENLRLLKEGERVVAGLGIYPMAQWFGGAKVRLAGITCVGVAPEYRGRGAGRTLLSHVLEELHEQHYPLSGLYPATTNFYRGLGYELSGSRVVYELATDAIETAERSLDMVPLASGEEQAIYDAYEVLARQTAGLLDRHPAIWQRRFEHEKPVRRYLIQQGGRVEGYIVFVQNQAMGEPMIVLDYAALTPAAGRRLLTFWRDHRTMIPAVQWAGGPLDPLVGLLPEQKAKIVKQSAWMTRIIDLPGALAARAYPSQLRGELHLEITDELLPWNNGRFTARLQAGKLLVNPGGEGRLRLGVRELAALYTGFQTPGELRLTGQIEGPEDDLQLTGLIFAGPRPWLPEIY